MFVPVVFRYRGYRFFFYSNEGDPLEPLHVHVQRGECVAKFWVTPTVSLAESYDLSSAELRMLTKVVKAKRELIERSWNEYFGS